MQDHTKEAAVQVFVLFFIFSILFMGLGLWFYNNKESTAFHNVLTEVNALKAELKRLDAVETIQKTHSVRIGDLEQDFEDCEKQLDVFRDQVGETREKQIQLRDALSRKRTKVYVTQGAIPMEIMGKSPKVPDGPPKDLIKKVKKQMRELSQ